MNLVEMGDVAAKPQLLLLLNREVGEHGQSLLLAALFGIPDQEEGS